MYICKNCAMLFDEPKRITERHGFDYGPYEEWYCCPFCGGDYEETMPCCECGEYITGRYAQLANDEVYCEDCFTIHDIRD